MIVEYRSRRAKILLSMLEAKAKAADALKRAETIDREIADLDRAAALFGLIHVVPTRHPEQQRKHASMTLFGFVDEYVKKAYPRDCRVTDIRPAAEAELGRKFHAKSVGVALQRLKTLGLVENTGWDWRYITPTASPA